MFDLKKKVSFLYQNITDLHQKNSFLLRFYYLAKHRNLKNFLFLNSEIGLLSYFEYVNYDFLLNEKRVFLFYFPVRDFFEKLRILGFIHLYKLRPIGNVNYISYDDWFIIKSFGFLAYCLLSWFRFCNNFSKVKYLIEIIRQSCFLTLSRKHNKSKAWAHDVYTYDLVVSNNLFFTNSFFPNRNFFFKKNSNFNISELVYFNLNLFLED